MSRFDSTRTRRSCGSTGTACVCTTPSVNQPGVVIVNDRSKRVAIKADGDGFTATPYRLSVVEDVHMVGSFIGTNRNHLASSTNHVKHCGDAAGTQDTLKGDIGRWVECPLAVAPSDSQTTEAAVGIAQTKALADLRSSMMHIPMLIAERKQTLATLVGHARVLSSRVSTLKQTAIKRYGQLSGPKGSAGSSNARKRLARDLSNEHLAVLFGLMPLIDEARGAVEFLRSEPSLLLTGRGNQAFEEEESIHGSNLPQAASSFVFDTPYFNVVTNTKMRTSARCSLTGKVSMSAGQAMRDLGFNPFATAYDLVPLSFLSEFVSNLGTFIRSLDPLIGVDFARGNVTTWHESTVDTFVTGASGYFPLTGGNGYSCKFSANGQARTRALEVVRTPLSNWPDPTLHLVNNLTWAKALTVASLAVQRYVKLSRIPKTVRAFRYKGPRPKYLPPIKYQRY